MTFISESYVVVSDVRGGASTITLNRPRQLNAIDLEVAAQLLAAVHAVGENPEVRMVILRGAGSGFCSGGDVHAMAAADDAPAFINELTESLHAAILALSTLGKPVVAVVHGVVAGAGLGLMLTADIILAASNAKFVAAYSRIGLSPDAGTSVLVPAAIGTTRALDFFLGSRTLDANTAAEWGLITRSVPPSDLDDAVMAQLGRFSEVAGEAHGTIRQLLRRQINRELVHALPLESQTIAQLSGTPAAQALTSAFIKR